MSGQIEGKDRQGAAKQSRLPQQVGMADIPKSKHEKLPQIKDCSGLPGMYFSCVKSPVKHHVKMVGPVGKNEMTPGLP